MIDLRVAGRYPGAGAGVASHSRAELLTWVAVDGGKVNVRQIDVADKVHPCRRHSMSAAMDLCIATYAIAKRLPDSCRQEVALLVMGLVISMLLHDAMAIIASAAVLGQHASLFLGACRLNDALQSLQPGPAGMQQHDKASDIWISSQKGRREDVVCSAARNK